MEEQVTPFEVITDRLLRKIEKDKDFFSYYNVPVSDIQDLVEEQAIGYLYDAIDLLVSQCEPEVNFYDYDEENDWFNFELTQREIGLLASLMYQVYFERDEAMLKAFKLQMTPNDLRVFSPANERKTFMDMLAHIKEKNTNDIARYIGTDRLTGQRKSINHSLYDYTPGEY